MSNTAVVDSITNTNTTHNGDGTTTTSITTIYNPNSETGKKMIYTGAGVASTVGIILILPYVVVGGLGIYLIYRLSKK